MARAKATDEGNLDLITNDEMQFVLWSSRRRLPPGWRYVGRSGPRAELEKYLREMMIETVPAPLLVADKQSLDSRWG